MCCEWYAASLALPVNDFPVLVTYKKTWHAGKKHQPRRPKQVTIAVYGDDMAWHFVRRRDHSNRPERITHWMPLPEPAGEWG